jgi:uncharacterized protein YlxW (UPF0749 family)
MPGGETRSQGEVETPPRETDPVTTSPDGPQPPATGTETADQAADPGASGLASPDPAADELPTARGVARKPPATGHGHGSDPADGPPPDDAGPTASSSGRRPTAETHRDSYVPAAEEGQEADERRGVDSRLPMGDDEAPPPPTARIVARKPATTGGPAAASGGDGDRRTGPEADGNATAEAGGGAARPPAPRRAPEGADGDEATPATRPAAGRVGVGLSGVLPPPLAPPETGPGTGSQPSDVDSARTGPRRSIFARTLGGTPAGLLIGLLVGLLGFGLVVQLRSNTASNGLAAARQEDLVRILDDLSSREERLRRQIALLEAARNRLSTTGDRDAAALQEALSRSTALGILAGTLPAQGPGIELRMTDPSGRLRAEDMLDAVEELRAAGAEAIQVGSVRIGLDSAFTDSDEGVRVDGRALQSPYVVLAIGDPATLATALNIPGGVVDSTRAAGGEATITQQRQLVIRALRPLPGHDYARPADDGD